MEKILYTQCIQPRGAVHLHVRGENDFFYSRSNVLSGSSPRAWRKWPSFSASEAIARFISTCVEKMFPFAFHKLRSTVHLHVRGENIAAGRRKKRHDGSSPRAWRKFNQADYRNQLQRFISTCVEKIWLPKAVISLSPVHLHVRGENIAAGR